jgi:hypothetical protein
MKNVERIIASLTEKGKTIIKFADTKTFKAEVRVDTEHYIDFNVENVATDYIKLKTNAFGKTLLLFNSNNITWVSDEDTERILNYINEM